MKYHIKCHDCGRYLGSTTKSLERHDLKCSGSNCKKLLSYKVVMLSDYMKKHTHKESKS